MAPPRFNSLVPWWMAPQRECAAASVEMNEDRSPPNEHVYLDRMTAQVKDDIRVAAAPLIVLDVGDEVDNDGLFRSDYRTPLDHDGEDAGQVVLRLMRG
ncbi:uncharacterized protein DNG_03858 [Cephalotrichum gorgonifer]|uniref:Uncharacterized protein n=1 Tax=Cephalotrichum gorgonifer TaxID=2041049 RepID=A0AAE8SU10_9PEZI|nr:uncharacterized protein DNG_03858 [Cephalotrichum gorgonifer]